MPIKAYATCDLCQSDFPIQLVEGRRGLREPSDLGINIETNTGKIADRNIATDNEYTTKGERRDDSIDYNTVCEPCRKSIRKVVEAEVSRLKKVGKGKVG